MRKFVLATVCALLFLMTFNVYGVILPSISNLQVSIRDNVVDRNVAYFIRFTTSVPLVGGRDSFTIKFPSEVIISNKINSENVSINESGVGGIDYNRNTLKLLLPSQLSIPAGGQVQIGVAGSVIKNPRVAGNYQIRLKTSLSDIEVVSEPFNITDYETVGGVSKPSVYISVAQTGINARYRVVFKTSSTGKLVGNEQIRLIFPGDTLLPSTVDCLNVKINGQYPKQVLVNPAEKKLSLVLAQNSFIPPESLVEIIIDEKSGIKKIEPINNSILKIVTSHDVTPTNSFLYQVDTDYAKADLKTGITVTTSLTKSTEAASYLIEAEAGLFEDYGSTLRGFVLTFPSEISLPTNIAIGYITINQLPVKGIVINSETNEMWLLMPDQISTSDRIAININKQAGIKNSTTGNFRITVDVLKKANALTSDYYMISSQSVVGQNSSSNSAINGIVLQVGSLSAQVGNTLQNLDSAPIIVQNVTLVPLRFVSEVLGATAEFNSTGNYVTVKYAGKEMTLWVNSTLAKVNGAFVSIQAPATISNSRLMVPVRFISENFGAQVSWDDVTRKITIIQGGGTTVPAAPTAPTIPQNQYPIGYRAVIKPENSYVNVRSGPGTAFSVVSKIYPGGSLTILSTEGDWYKVKLASGQEAWVANWVVDVPRV